MKWITRVFLLLSILYLLPGCTGPEDPSPGSSVRQQGDLLTIVTTTGMLADAARNIAGDLATVEALMGPGVDPHGYTASQGDVQRLRQADLIVYNGIHLEGKMQDVLESLARSKPVFALGDGLDPKKLRSVAAGAGTHDPHIWFDVPLWSSGVRELSVRMGEQFPQYREIFLRNAETYLDQLEQLDAELRTIYATVPAKNRVLITSHDAFEYFGAAYGFDVKGLQGVSTVAEFGLRDVTDLVNLITERRIPAVFIESSVPPRSIESVVEGCREKGHLVKIGGLLFSDAMGAEGTPEGTYRGMLLHNAHLITAALSNAPGTQPVSEPQP